MFGTVDKNDGVSWWQDWTSSNLESEFFPMHSEAKLVNVYTCLRTCGDSSHSLIQRSNRRSISRERFNHSRSSQPWLESLQASGDAQTTAQHLGFSDDDNDINDDNEDDDHDDDDDDDDWSAAEAKHVLAYPATHSGMFQAL